jgi:hypothetical protein
VRTAGLEDAAGGYQRCCSGVFALTLPPIPLSGFFIERPVTPPLMQWLGHVIPLTYFWFEWRYC